MSKTQSLPRLQPGASCARRGGITVLFPSGRPFRGRPHKSAGGKALSSLEGPKRLPRGDVISAEELVRSGG